MLILSIHPGHNATAGLLRDGEIIGLLSQEKLDNKKNSAAFPLAAAERLLLECQLDWSDIDEIAIAGTDVFPEECYDYLFGQTETRNEQFDLVKALKAFERGVGGHLFPGLFRYARSVRHASLVQDGMAELKSKLDASPLKGKPVTHIDHHQCHASSAYYGLATDDAPALVFTADGSGDDACATVSVVRNGRIERIAKTPPQASLGGIYSNTTRFLGMKILEHEYKVMGLAPYCKGYEKSVYERIFSPVIDLDPANPLVFKAAVDCTRFYDYLCEHAVGERFDNVAGAVQMLLEERIVSWISAAIERTGIRRVFTGGGVFMNVKLNKRIQEMPEVESVRFLPSAGDESNPIGAAYALAVSRGVRPEPLNNLYLGISFSDDYLATFVEAHQLRGKYRVQEYADMENEIARLLAEREVVARFAGRCEWGARSLGNRAILAHPSHMESFYTVNDLIKARDFWMPFAPSMLDIDAQKYLEQYHPDKVEAPYMITAYQATPLAQKELKAAMHQGDHTLRPQVVKREANPGYYRLIESFRKKTGVGAVLNTSLNLHGYPLVATPEQALMTLERSGLRHLALGSFLISKK